MNIIPDSGCRVCCLHNISGAFIKVQVFNPTLGGKKEMLQAKLATSLFQSSLLRVKGV
jgi:hypothetical protein